MRPAVGLVAALVPLLVLRAVVAVGETTISRAREPRRPGLLREATLASAAGAGAQVTCAVIAALVTILTWRLVGRGLVPVALAVAIPLVLVVCDLVPRGLAADAPGRYRRLVDPLLRGLAVVLAPLLLLERGLGMLLRVPPAALTALHRLGGWLGTRVERSPLDVSETGLVARMRRFGAKTARDAMVPFVDVCAVPDTATVGQVVALVRERGFSRLPVFHERMFNTIGVVSSLDLLGVTEPSRPVTGVMREPLFVPEKKPLPELLATLQAEGRNLAIVVDEYGGAVGLITVEDLVEEIVGEIEDEYDAPQELYRRLARGLFLVNARAPVSQVNERFGWNLPQGEYETLGGLVLERLGRVPKAGDTVDAGRVRIEVTRATPRAVQELVVRVHGRG